jgi:restriction system protein
MSSQERRLSPFTDHLATDVENNLIGRSRELEYLRDVFLTDTRGIEIVGPPGSGKTLLARVFSGRFSEKLFPAGILTVTASWVESPDNMFYRVLQEDHIGLKLIVVDAAETLEDKGLQRIQSLLERSDQLRLLVTSRRPLLPLGADFHQLSLGCLSRSEFERLLHLRSELKNDQIDKQVVEKLFDLAQGNLLLADLAVSAVNQGVVPSWVDLLDHLRTFKVPGVLGPDGQPINLKSKEHQKIVIDVTAANTEIMRLLKKDPDLARKLPPRKFEEIVAEILSKQGYEVELTSASRDGGFDICAARQDGLGKFLYLVECKRYVPPNKVGVEIVRSLHGVIHSNRATAGAIVSTSFFTAGAIAYQRKMQHQLHIHDFLALQRWIHDFPLSGRISTV